MREKFVDLAGKIIFLGFGAIFFVTPLLLTTFNSELFEFNKMFLVYAVAVIIGAAWVIKVQSYKGKKGEKGVGDFREFWGFKVAKTPLDIPILAFLGSQILSTIFSIDSYISIWGYYSRQNGGLLSTISYIVLYYAFVSNFRDRRYRSHKTNKSYINKFLFLALTSGFIVAAYGILQHFGVDRDLWIQDVENRVFSTLGQPNWLAAYMAILSFLSLGVGIGRILDRDDKVEKRTLGIWVFKAFWWVGLVAIFYLTILYTKSRSGLLGFWVGNAVFWVALQAALLSGKRIKRFFDFSFNKTLLRAFFTLHFILLILSFIVGVSVAKFNRFMLPAILKRLEGKKIEKIVISKKDNSNSQGTLIARGGTESGKIRKFVWQGAIAAAKANPIFGTGVETFAWAFYQYKPKEHNLTSEWDFLYNKAHNEYLNFAATTGFVGLGAYLLVIGGFVGWVIIGNWRKKSKSQLPIDNSQLLIIGLFSAWVTILITNFFGFSVVVTNIYFWLIPAIVFTLSGFAKNEAQTTYSSKIGRKGARARVGRVWGASAVGVVIISSFLLVILGRYWYSDVLFARSKELVSVGYNLAARKNLQDAVKLRPGEPNIWDELGYIESLLAVEAAQRGEDKRANELILQALEDQGKAINISPQNLNFLKTRVRVYFTLSQIDRNLLAKESRAGFIKQAIDLTKIIHKLAPNDPKILYNLALLERLQEENLKPAGSGIKSQVGKGIGSLKEALKLKPDYRAARIALGLFYSQSGNVKKAREQFEYVLKNINPEDKEARGYLEEIYE